MREERIIPAEFGGQRADRALRSLWPETSRAAAKRLFADGRVRAAGQRVKPGATVPAGAILSVDWPEPPAVEEALPHAVAGGLVLVNKPCGLPSHARFPGEASVASWLVRLDPQAWTGEALREAGLAHRLDTPTSGLLAAARTLRDALQLRDLFKGNTVVKTYLAWVEGEPAFETEDVETGFTQRGPRVTAQGDIVRATRVEVLECGGERTLVRCHIRRGFRHQIRAHLALVGHPVCGDGLYGGQPGGPVPPGAIALHSQTLRFRWGKAEYHASAPLPVWWQMAFGAKEAPGGPPVVEVLDPTGHGTPAGAA